jgi:DNA-directed RNA polymerases I, II, and III subunit RPABC1
MFRKDNEMVLQVLKVISEMIESRKFDDDDELTSYTQMSIEEFSEIYEQSIINGLSFGPINHSIIDDSKLVIKIIMSNTKKANIREICESYIKEYDSDIKIIIIMKDKITTNITKEINQDKYKNVEVFQVKNLLVNITKHHLQPKFDIILPNEEEYVIKQFVSVKLTPGVINQFKSKLPKIIKDDPVARFYGLRTGNLLKITRMNEQSGKYIMFRCCA